MDLGQLHRITFPINNPTFWGKLIMVSLYANLNITELGKIDLPFLAALEFGENNHIFHKIFFFAFLATSTISLITKYSIAMIISGILIITAVLANSVTYSNNLLFSGCILISLALSTNKRPICRFQLSIVYLGAFLDKLCYNQWRDGSFFQSFFQSLEIGRVINFSSESNTVFLVLAIISITVEAFLATTVLIPRLNSVFIIVGLTFHTSTVLMMHSSFGLFLPCILISYMSLLPIHKELKLKLPTIHLHSASPPLQNTPYPLKNTAINLVSNSPITYVILTMLIGFGPFKAKLFGILIWVCLMISIAIKPSLTAHDRV